MASRNRENLRERIARFVQQYARKARRGLDPNDRSYDRNIERIVKQMNPEELDRLLHGADDELDTPDRPDHSGDPHT